MSHFHPLFKGLRHGTKMKDSQIGRSPWEHCRNHPDYPIGSHDSLLERSIIELCRKIVSDLFQAPTHLGVVPKV